MFKIVKMKREDALERLLNPVHRSRICKISKIFKMKSAAALETYLTFNVLNAINTKISPTIQKRITTFDSFHPDSKKW